MLERIRGETARRRVQAVVAGHCFPDTMVVLPESRARTEGTVLKRHFASITNESQDLELIGKEPYAGRVSTGGFTSMSSLPVHEAGTAVVGFNNYRSSGRTTGEQCGTR